MANLNSKKKFQDEQEKRFLTYFGIEYPYVPPKHKWSKDIVQGKILLSADWHEPYMSDLIRKEMLTHKDAETHIVAGDIGDYYSKSRFRKTKHVTFKEEVQSVFHALEYLSTHWKTVKVMLGNHDNRPEKIMLGKVAETGEIDLLVLTEMNLLKRLASYFDNIEVVGTSINGDIELTHIYQFGDAIFTHGELSMKQDSAILERISTYLSQWRTRLKLKPYRAIFQAHNHRATKTIKSDELQMLIPTASEGESIGFEYIYGTRMIGTPPQQGYTVLYQKNGITEFNKTNYYIV